MGLWLCISFTIRKSNKSVRQLDFCVFETLKYRYIYFMTTQALEKTVRKLSRDIVSLRSFVIEVVRNDDDEGEYKKSFIKNILNSVKKNPNFEYSKRGSLLRQIRNA